MYIESSYPNAQEILAQTLEQAGDGVVIVDANHCITLFNKAAETLWGRCRDEVLGQHIGQLMPFAPLSKLIASDGTGGSNPVVGSSMEVTIERRDGATLCGALSVSKLRVEGAVFHAIFIRDVTEEARRREELRLLSLGANETANAVVITGADSRIIYVNAGFTRMLGYELAEARGKIPSQLLSGQHTDPQVIEYAKSHVALQQDFHVEILVYDKQNRPLWISAMINPVFNDAGQLQNMVAVYANITHTKMHEVLQHKVLNAMVREAPLLEVAELICREVEHIAPDVVVSILRVDAEDRLRPLAAPSLPDPIAQAIDGLAIGPDVGACGSAAYWGEQVVATDITTDPRWALHKHLFLPLGLVACWSNPIKASDGRVLGTLAFYYRAHREPDAFLERLSVVCEHLCALALERDEARVNIRKLAFYDVLTGLPNRRRLYAKATQAIEEVMRSGAPLAVLFVDLDRFKQVNDSLGHAVGDELLCETALRIKAQLRECDIVGRLSGDEFVIVAPDCNSHQAAEIAERLLAGLSRPIVIGGVKLRSSASIGISLYPDSGHHIEQLLQHADMAMYQAKMAGRHRCCFFSAEMDRQVQERQALELALREALEQKQLQLHYQPQVRLGDSRLYGVEALARWHHPQLGDVSPARFVPLAEECGLVMELGHWALHEACRQLAEWRRRGLAIPAVSVNLSPKNFHHLGLPRLIADILRQHGLSPTDLTLEMTESVLMDGSPETLSTISALHEQGVRLSIDDFGTGYSSLGYLHRLPVDELKLDKRFVHDLDNDEAARALTHAIIRIGESLHLTVVAEGVESETQRCFLAKSGCQVAQGYLFARPMPVEALERWMTTTLACAST
ncbi:EAL domain-containing protein [Crenobacter sp. SG2303]|uniref:EAL domain-containing protein n=1 Tax=Crenobacter oryzisoli TaxID=3056844 RepID=A0ABT7XSJ7_9NEIS|nr:EAL domain-containing protein [Crenobacter sp. SG2303]MDN0076781.1 EAL domain-containing protein [Crenobacter sp. SG2303]